jgi:hypothetical protein
MKGHEDGARPFFSCPRLGGEVELTRERERHILDHHPDTA